MPAGLAIHRFSARTPARAQPVAARLALQALGADLEDALPRSLPPQALLWLRRLQLQAPEAALLRPAPAAWRQDWIAAGRARFDAALTQAARPALGPVPDSAPAVLFADAAEMLACLALAAQAGQMDRWWWRGLLGRAWPQAQAAWGARPEAQAGAVRLLARIGQGGAATAWRDEWVAVPALSLTLPAAESRAVEVKPAATRHAAESMPPAAPRAVGVQAMPAAAADEVARVAAIRRRGAAPRAIEPAIPASPTASEMPDASVDAAATAAPPVVSIKLPPAAASVAQAAPEDVRPASTASAASAPVVRPLLAGVTVPPQRRSGADVQAQHRPGDETTAAAGMPAVVPAPAAVQAASADAPCESPVTPSRVIAREAEAGHPPVEQARPPEVVTREPIAAQPPALIDDSAMAWPWPHAVLSRQAPLLFIVNVLLEDGLYPDFTRPRDPGLPVPLWALLAALAGAWRLPTDELQSALQERCPDWTPPDLMPDAPGAPAGPWPVWLAAYARSLRRRLCRRLGLRPPAWPQALTLASPARLWLSEAEWVAEFDLGAHDVAWRLAGLDRDPGWLPSTGVSLRFVFVS